MQLREVCIELFPCLFIVTISIDYVLDPEHMATKNKHIMYNRPTSAFKDSVHASYLESILPVK